MEEKCGRMKGNKGPKGQGKLRGMEIKTTD
jgi:hypothetical protein